MVTAHVARADSTVAVRPGGRSSIPVTPSVVPGRVTHARHGAVAHRFAHATYLWLVDLDDLPRSLGRSHFRAGDHLGDADRTIKQNVLAFLTAQGCDVRGIARVLMLASPRTTGYVFNPLTVHWCVNDDGEVVWIVAEVHNTYGERHAYLIDPSDLRQDGRADVAKAFYVSPFYEVAGRYRMRFRLRSDDIAISIALHDDGEAPAKFHAAFRGTPYAATMRRRLVTAMRVPMATLRTTALIRVHGIWLYLRRLPVIKRTPHHPPDGI